MSSENQDDLCIFTWSKLWLMTVPGALYDNMDMIERTSERGDVKWPWIAMNDNGMYKIMKIEALNENSCMCT